MTLDLEWWRLYYSFVNLTKWRERRVTCQQLIDDIKHAWKNIVFFQVWCYGFSRGWKSLCNTVVYMIKTIIKKELFKNSHLRNDVTGEISLNSFARLILNISAKHNLQVLVRDEIKIPQTIPPISVNETHCRVGVLAPLLTEMRLNKAINFAAVICIFVICAVVATIPCQTLLLCDVRPSTFNSARDFFWITVTCGYGMKEYHLFGRSYSSVVSFLILKW